MSLDCRDRELQKQTRQTLGCILLIGCLGSLPAQVTIWQTNQHHLQHRCTNQHTAATVQVTIWQTNQHHLQHR